MGRLADLKFLTTEDFRIVERIDMAGESHFRVQKRILSERSRSFTIWWFYLFETWRTEQDRLLSVWKDVTDKIIVSESIAAMLLPWGDSKEDMEKYIKAALEENKRVVTYAHRKSTVKEIYHYL